MTPPSISRVEPYGKKYLSSSLKNPCFQILCSGGLSCHLLLRPVEEREGEDDDGGNSCQVLAVRESGWRKTSVFAMSLSQNISFRDKALLSRRIGKAPASTWFVRLISDWINLVLILGLRVLSW